MIQPPSGPTRNATSAAASSGRPQRPKGSLSSAAAVISGVAQPVCRAKMRIADLGPVEAGVVAGPLRAGDSLAAAGEPVDLRCGPLPPGAGGG